MKTRWIIGLIAVAAFAVGRLGTPEPVKPNPTTAPAAPPTIVALTTSPSTSVPVAPPVLRPTPAPTPEASAPALSAPPAATPPPVPSPTTGSAPWPLAVPGPAATIPEVAYVMGDRVALRAAASGEGRILDRLNRGQVVHRLSRQGEWWRVRHGLTQQEGWISERRLSSEPPPRREPETAAKPENKPISPSVALAASAIVALLIHESVSAYRASRPCACPYNLTRNGRSCGGNSAWSRAGGAKPLCYPDDITPAMIAAFRARPR